MTSFSLRQVKLRPGERYRDELEVELSPLDYGGRPSLPVPAKVPVEFEITRANTGTVFSLAFTARLFGPCYRCLGDAVLELPIRAREYQAENPEDEEMTTEYVDGNMLDASGWARDALALALHDKTLCRPAARPRVGPRRGPGPPPPPKRSSAGPTAPASAASAGRT